MKRNIEWKEKTEDGAKRVVRVNFPGRGQIKWQFKCSDEERWDYDSEPTPEDWTILEEKVDRLYHRHRCALRDWELVKAMKEKHG